MNEEKICNYLCYYEEIKKITNEARIKRRIEEIEK